ncbi:alpha/beta fold hydrolase [Streptomyces sp. 2BBP-J2]|uniref:alpha/beta fold hydrolase n=1 Tax=Streptomyces sp. 2BBP-J2 TaxID=2719381 RepID=UPI00398749BE
METSNPPATRARPRGADHAVRHHRRRSRDLLQGLGLGPAGHVPPRLAAELGRLGRPVAVPRPAGLPRRRPRPPRHGRSAQAGHGHDMDRYAADAATVVAHLGLRDVVHVGHCAGGGEVARYIARHGAGRVAKAVLIAAVPPLMVQTASNPAGLPAEVFDGFREGVATDRSQFYLDLASGPFYGFNRPGADVSQGVIQNWWRQGMAGSAQAHHEGIGAFSETDFTDDLRAIDVPTLLLHGDDDQIVPIANSARTAVALAGHADVKVYPGLSHGMCTVNADTVNADLLDFIRS